jgi:hypothetical protein
VDQRRPALGEAGELKDVEEDREKDLGNRRGLLAADSVGDVRGGARVDDDLLRVAAARQQCHGAIPGAPARHAIGHLDYFARALETEDLGRARRGRVQALALQQVGAIHRRCRHANAQRIGYQLRRRNVADAQVGLVTGLVDDDGSHGGVVYQSECPSRCGESRPAGRLVRRRNPSPRTECACAGPPPK